jgi:hypothetical protein
MNDAFASHYCLRNGSHLFSLQIHSTTSGNSSIISLSFWLGWNYGCGPAGGLIGIRGTGTFPDLRFTFRAVITPPWSGVLFSQFDDNDWKPVRQTGTQHNLTISETTGTNASVLCSGSSFPEPGYAAGYHYLRAQMQSEEGHDSNLIVLSFILATDYGDPRYPGPTQSPPPNGGFSTEKEQGGGSSLLAPLLGTVGTVVGIVVAGIVVMSFLGGTAPVGNDVVIVAAEP